MCSDSVPEFVDLMNLKAQQLCLHNTHFENPNGLDGEHHYSTAADLAQLTRYALQNADFVEIVSTKKHRIGARCLTNHNRLLWTVDGAIGVKTGYTRAAGRILVSAAERNGRRLIAVTINDGNDWQDHARLYDYGFSRYTEQVVVHRGDVVAELHLMDGTTAKLVSNEDVRCYLADNENANVTLLYPRTAFSAGVDGTQAGFAAVYVGEKRIKVIHIMWNRLEETDEGTVTENTLGTFGCFPPCR